MQLFSKYISGILSRFEINCPWWQVEIDRLC